ncbi:MAG: phosphoribosylanthranilate isomerase [Dehalococcoidia bacterium]|nr:phosphoribosylanthranilate isomerase [Dehalococcoidia bacterium]MDP6782585.1 phosphoribosylanthranilate isomerase [Dehalococcoidia bacterium]
MSTEVRVKICGITSLEDALMAAEAGANALGFVFAPSPRRVTPEQVREMVHHLPPFIIKVGVFVDSPLREVRKTLSFCSLHLAQLHGQEPPDFCQALFPHAIKSFRVRNAAFLERLPDYKAAAFLLEGHSDTGFGGTGTGFDWGLALRAKAHGRIILSGGLSPANVADAVGKVGPYAVDTSSGVESAPGRKDPAKVRAFIRAAREALVAKL